MIQPKTDPERRIRPPADEKSRRVFPVNGRTWRLRRLGRSVFVVGVSDDPALLGAEQRLLVPSLPLSPLSSAASCAAGCAWMLIIDLHSCLKKKQLRGRSVGISERLFSNYMRIDELCLHLELFRYLKFHESISIFDAFHSLNIPARPNI